MSILVIDFVVFISGYRIVVKVVNRKIIQIISSFFCNFLKIKNQIN